MRLVYQAHGLSEGVIPGALVVDGVALWITGRQRLAFFDRQLRTHNIAHKLRAESAAERCKNWDSHCGWAGTQALRSKFTFSGGVRNVGGGKKLMFAGPFVALKRELWR